MRLPSIKILVERLKLTKEQATALRVLMTKNKGLACFNKQRKGYGIEGFRLPEDCNPHETPALRVEYVNLGDGYTDTLLKVNGQYRVGCWADLVEKFQS